jgi:Ca-activated chloride channel family protein
MDIQYGNTAYFYLIAIAALPLLLTVFAIAARRAALRRFASPNLVGLLGAQSSGYRRVSSAVLLSLALALIALALVDIRWGKMEQEVPQRGIEVMFVLDVSRSMLANDVNPSRLDRGKQQIKDLMDEMAGDRIGLMVFAGDTRQVVPLTSHYGDFVQALDAVTPDSVLVGGSRLGDAIRAAAGAFINKTNDHKAVVIFTDGEDQESKPIEAARAAVKDQGIRIFTVGLGDIEQGAKVPAGRDARGQGQFLSYKGEAVWSKLNGEILTQIASETGGAYIPAGTKRVNMADIYHGYIAKVEQTEFAMAKVNAYIPRYEWFAFPALVLLLVEGWLSTSQRQSAASRRTALAGPSTLNSSREAA